jgi:hypothetical protein
MGYRIDGWTQTEEVQGGNRIVPVREFHVYSLPSETYFQFRRGKKGTAWIDPKATATQLAERIEKVLALPHVIDVVYSQNISAGGRLLDWMTTYYATEDGSISGSVESEMAKFGPTFTGKQVAKEIADGGDLIG